MNIMQTCLVLLCCCILYVMQVSASRSSSPLASMLNFAKTKYAKPKHAKTKSDNRKVQKGADVDKVVTEVEVEKLKGGDAKSRKSGISTTPVLVVVDLNNTRHDNTLILTQSSFLLNVRKNDTQVINAFNNNSNSSNMTNSKNNKNNNNNNNNNNNMSNRYH